MTKRDMDKEHILMEKLIRIQKLAQIASNIKDPRERQIFVDTINKLQEDINEEKGT